MTSSTKRSIKGSAQRSPLLTLTGTMVLVPMLALGSLSQGLVSLGTAAIAAPDTMPEVSDLEAPQAFADVLERSIEVKVDREALEQAARPLLRQSLRTVLDVAPELSRRAVILGEWYLGRWSDRALEELDHAAKRLESLEEKFE